MKRLKRLLGRKLKSTAGESLVEVLVSLLIAALAILLLGQTLDVSVNMVRRSGEAMEDYYAANNVLAARGWDDSAKAVAVVTWADSNEVVDLGVGEELNVSYCVNENAVGSTVIAYGLSD